MIELTRHPSAYGAYLVEFILQVRNMLKPHLEKIHSSPEGAVLLRQIEGVGAIVENYLRPQVRNLSPKAFILCLEESQLFR